MWRNLSRNFREKGGWWLLALPVWVFVSFMVVQLVLSLVIFGLSRLGVPFENANQPLLQTLYGVVVYGLTILVVVGLPWKLRKARTTREDIGLQVLPRFRDLGLAPAGFVVYLLISGVLLWIAPMILTFVDFEQVQDVGFNGLHQGLEYLFAFVTLVVIAPIAEEVLFRGYLFGKLRKHVPVWVAVLATSLVFAVVHGAWNVGIDVFALSIVLCLLRIASGSLWPSIILHMMKNFLAFYLLFINPSLLGTLG